MSQSSPSNTTFRKIARRPDEGHLAGVCAGAADYLNVDPALVRWATIALGVLGPGIPMYLIAWLVFPAVDGSVLVEGFPRHPNDKRTQIVGIVLIALSLSVLWGGWWTPARHWFIPLALMGGGAWLLLRGDRDDLGDRPSPAPPAPPTPPGPSWSAPTPTSVVPAPPAPAGATEASTPHTPGTDDMTTTTDDPTTDEPTTDEPTTDDPTTDDLRVIAPGEEPLADPADPATSVFAPGAVHWRPTPPGGGDGGDATTTFAGDPPPPAPWHRAPKRRRIVGPLAFGALLLWGGIAWLAGVQVDDALAIGLCILGVAFVVGAFIGGSRALVLPAIVVGAALATTSMVDIPWSGGIGEQLWDPHSLGELSDDYELGIGEGTLDLQGLALVAGDHADVQVDVGIGHLIVLVPDDLGVEVHTEVGAGQVDLFDRTDDGVGVELDRTITGSEGQGTVTLDLHVGFGHLEVKRVASGAAADAGAPELPTTTTPIAPLTTLAA